MRFISPDHAIYSSEHEWRALHSVQTHIYSTTPRSRRKAVWCHHQKARGVPLAMSLYLHVRATGRPIQATLAKVQPTRPCHLPTIVRPPIRPWRGMVGPWLPLHCTMFSSGAFPSYHDNQLKPSKPSQLATRATVASHSFSPTYSHSYQPANKCGWLARNTRHFVLPLWNSK